jgi:hypothetical protein
MYLRELRDLDQQIAVQRRKFRDDRLQVKRALTDVPREIARALGSREGLIICFSAGAAAAGLAPARGGLSVTLLDLFARVAIAELPSMGDLVREHRRKHDAEPES